MTRPVNNSEPKQCLCGSQTTVGQNTPERQVDRRLLGARIMAAASAFRATEAIGTTTIGANGEIIVDEARADRLVSRIVDEIAPLLDRAPKQ